MGEDRVLVFEEILCFYQISPPSHSLLLCYKAMVMWYLLRMKTLDP